MLIMAGGTGGHVFPALAVAAVLRARGCAVHWLGTRRGIEARLVPQQDYPITFLKVRGLRGKRLWARVSGAFGLLAAGIQALAVVRRIRPQVVVGFGGYVAGPGGLAARLLGIPLVIHEQNAVAGTTNRLLTRWATRVLTGFPGVLPGAVHTGNPLRAEIAGLADAAKACAADRVHLLVLGGSLGARALNHAVPAALARLPAAERPLVRHQCGADHLDAARAAYRAAGIEAEVVPFIDDMAAAYRWADLAICRAGALTVAELAAAGLPAILVPFPHAIDDHQYHNGQWLAQAGAALLIREAELDPPRLAVALDALLGDAARRAAMAAGARALALPAAARVVADACLEVAR